MGEKIAEKWKTLGRRLGIEDPKVEGIEHQYDQLGEKGYQMLRLWKQEEGSAATYQALCDALKRVGRKDLAEQFCCIDGNVVCIIKCGHGKDMGSLLFQPPLPHPGV